MVRLAVREAFDYLRSADVKGGADRSGGAHTRGDMFTACKT